MECNNTLYGLHMEKVLCERYPCVVFYNRHYPTRCSHPPCHDPNTRLRCRDLRGTLPTHSTQGGTLFHQTVSIFSSSSPAPLNALLYPWSISGGEGDANGEGKPDLEDVAVEGNRQDTREDVEEDA